MVNEPLTCVCGDLLANNGYSGHSLRCRSPNARSIVNKRVQLGALLESENLDVLAVTEYLL